MLPQTTTFRRLADCMLLLDPLLYFTEALRGLGGAREWHDPRFAFGSAPPRCDRNIYRSVKCRVGIFGVEVMVTVKDLSPDAAP